MFPSQSHHQWDFRQCLLFPTHHPNPVPFADTNKWTYYCLFQHKSTWNDPNLDQQESICNNFLSLHGVTKITLWVLNQARVDVSWASVFLFKLTELFRRLGDFSIKFSGFLLGWHIIKIVVACSRIHRSGTNLGSWKVGKVKLWTFSVGSVRCDFGLLSLLEERGTCPPPLPILSRPQGMGDLLLLFSF